MNKPQIMVVEDEGLVALQLKEVLGRMGYEVPAVVASGAAALEHVLEDCPDLVIMDIRLDGAIDGIETAKRIREIYSVPVIYLTADLNEKTLERAKETESYGYVIKPFDERSLRATIEITLSKAQRDREQKQENDWREIILKNIGECIVATDCKACVTHVNQLACEVLGREEARCLGRKLSEIIRLVDKTSGVSETLSVTKAVIENESIGKDECLLVIDSNRSFPVRYRLQPMKNKNENTIGALLFFKEL